LTVITHSSQDHMLTQIIVCWRHRVRW